MAFAQCPFTKSPFVSKSYTPFWSPHTCCTLVLSHYTDHLHCTRNHDSTVEMRDESAASAFRDWFLLPSFIWPQHITILRLIFSCVNGNINSQSLSTSEKIKHSKRLENYDWNCCRWGKEGLLAFRVRHWSPECRLLKDQTMLWLHYSPFTNIIIIKICDDCFWILPTFPTGWYVRVTDPWHSLRGGKSLQQIEFSSFRA